MQRTSSKRQGITMVEVALLICLAGILLAVAIPTFSRTFRASKTSEAVGHLRTLHRLTASYYAKRHRDSTGRKRLQGCIPEKAGPFPAQPSENPKHVDFNTASAAGFATWRALGFSPDYEIRYRYSLLPSRSGCDSERREGRVVYRAEGDLDGDGELSRFELEARTTSSNQLGLSEILFTKDRWE